VISFWFTFIDFKNYINHGIFFLAPATGKPNEP